MTARIYVDWSGDPGFRFRRGSSTLFLVAAITAQNQEISLALREVKAVPASQSDGLQAADMLAGLVRTEEQSLATDKITVIKYPV